MLRCLQVSLLVAIRQIAVGISKAMLCRGPVNGKSLASVDLQNSLVAGESAFQVGLPMLAVFIWQVAVGIAQIILRPGPINREGFRSVEMQRGLVTGNSLLQVGLLISLW